MSKLVKLILLSTICFFLANLCFAEESNIKFTNNERDFIKNNPKIYIGFLSNEPYTFIDDTAHINGFTIDTLKRMSKYINLQFEFKVFENVNDLREALFDDEVQVLLNMIHSKNREKLYLYGKAEFEIKTGIFVREENSNYNSLDKLSGKTLAVIENFGLNDAVRKFYPEIKLKYVNSLEDMLKSVANKEADATIMEESSALYRLLKLKIEHVRQSGHAEFSDISKIKAHNYVVAKNNAILLSILDKGFFEIKDKEFLNIWKAWFSEEQPKSANKYSFVDKNILLIFLLTVIFFISFGILRYREKYKKLELLSTTDKLTKLYNRTKLDQVLENEFNRAKSNLSDFGVIFIDIDYFKSINDTYGHQTGDTFLIEFSNLLKDYCKEKYIVGRWGGEEFLIISSNAKKGELIHTADKLRKTIESYSFSEVGNKTASFGCTLYNAKDQSTIPIISRADEALYNSKKSGRNKVSFK